MNSELEKTPHFILFSAIHLNKWRAFPLLGRKLGFFAWPPFCHYSFSPALHFLLNPLQLKSLRDTTYDQESSSDSLPGALAFVANTVRFLATSSTLPSALLLLESKGCQAHSEMELSSQGQDHSHFQEWTGDNGIRYLKWWKGGADAQRGDSQWEPQASLPGSHFASFV